MTGLNNVVQEKLHFHHEIGGGDTYRTRIYGHLVWHSTERERERERESLQKCSYNSLFLLVISTEDQLRFLQ